MKGRSLIKEQIIDSWSECMQTDYLHQRINSERSLQASFWAQLNKRLVTNRRLFIEPKMSAEEDGQIKRIHPDIVVCNSREIIAVIELKYSPRVKPRYGKDLRSLDFLARQRGAIRISNERYRGQEADAKDYGMSERVLFVWAGVHRPDPYEQEGSISYEYPSLSGCFLHMHAATHPSDPPDIYYYSG